MSRKPSPKRAAGAAGSQADLPAPAGGVATAVADQEPEVLTVGEPQVAPPPAARPSRDAASGAAKTRKDGSFADLDGVADRLGKEDARELPISTLLRDCWHQDGEASADQVNAAMRLLAKDPRFALHVRDKVYHAKLALVTTKAITPPRSPAFARGRSDHAAGKDMFECPYGSDVSNSSEWEDGWLDAENNKPALGDVTLVASSIPPGPVAELPTAGPAVIEEEETETETAPDDFETAPDGDDGDDGDDDGDDDEGGDDASGLITKASGYLTTEDPAFDKPTGKDAAAGETVASPAVVHAPGAYLDHVVLGRVKVLRYQGEGQARSIVVITEQGQEIEILAAFVGDKLKPAMDNGRTISEMVAEVKQAEKPPAIAKAPFAIRIGRWVLVRSQVGDGSEAGWISDVRAQETGQVLYDVVLKSGKVNGLPGTRLAEMDAATEAAHERLEEVDRLRALVAAQNRHGEEQRALTRQYRKLQEEAASIAERAKLKRKEIEAHIERMAVHGGGDIQLDWRDGVPEAEDEDAWAPTDEVLFGGAGHGAAASPATLTIGKLEFVGDPGQAIHASSGTAGGMNPPKPLQPPATAAKGKGSLRDQARSQQALREALPCAELGIQANDLPAAELVIAGTTGTVAMPVFQGGEPYALIREGLPDGYAEMRRLLTPLAWAQSLEYEFGTAKADAGLVEKDLKLERGGRRAGLVVKARSHTWVVGTTADSFYLKLA